MNSSVLVLVAEPETILTDWLLSDRPMVLGCKSACVKTRSEELYLVTSRSLASLLTVLDDWDWVRMVTSLFYEDTETNSRSGRRVGRDVVWRCEGYESS